MFAQFMRDTGRWRDCEPEALLARWSIFVESCIRSYEGDAEDYFNDLTARDGLERALREPILARFPELDDLRRAVLEIDAKFRKILRPDVFLGASGQEWWNRGIVSYAGVRLVEELGQTYGANIDRV
ncbi:hypothetical protein [Planosporangium mesophilum]|uniref:hypothetical protein n=1 Tax=Planosporangium mesophilum TaxID=689768 RepID=UPI0014390637|nr:hypothetical protein [Planosporangium mesophilum]NJC86298.1 hypothetical protein [Planosporangium mesophilum]